jgi:adenosylmethionine-8-amino-7-oxononanoate aminotransferase
MISEKVADVFESDKTTFGNIGHGYTYSAHPVGAAAALATIPEMMRLNVAENAGIRGNQLLKACEALGSSHEIVGDVRGKGLMVALEIVSDSANKTPASKETMQKIYDEIYNNGVMVRVSGNNIILSPPLIITASEVTKIVEAIGKGLSYLR